MSVIGNATIKLQLLVGRRRRQCLWAICRQADTVFSRMGL